jgi:hypothetical protein
VLVGVAVAVGVFVAAGVEVLIAAGVDVGVLVGVEVGVGVVAGVSQGVAGRNSGCRMRPPASAVQIASEIEMAFPNSTAELSQRAACGNLTKASRASKARMAQA